MLYDYLHEFTVIARERSLLRAASKLGISQPALGRHLSALETQLGAQLVVRTARGIQLTSEGRYALGIALDICSLGEALEDHFKRKPFGGINRHLLVAGLSNAKTAQALLANACTTVNRHGNDVALRYQMDFSLLSIADALNNDEADVVITFGNAIEREDLANNFHCVKLYASGGYAIMETNHPLASKTPLRLDDLKNTSIGRMEGHQGNSDLQWHEFRRNCERRGFSPITKTVGFDFVPGWGDWHLPNCIVVFCADNHNIPALERSGKRVELVEDLTYEIYAIARHGDPLACQLIDLAVQRRP